MQTITKKINNTQSVSMNDCSNLVMLSSDPNKQRMFNSLQCVPKKKHLFPPETTQEDKPYFLERIDAAVNSIEGPTKGLSPKDEGEIRAPSAPPGSSRQASSKQNRGRILFSSGTQPATKLKTEQPTSSPNQQEESQDADAPKKFDKVEAEAAQRRRYKQHILKQAQKHLKELALNHCGSAQKFYMLFDVDNSGGISFDEFSKGLALYNLDKLFPRPVQYIIYDEIDKDKNGSVDYNEFDDFLQLSAGSNDGQRNNQQVITESRKIQELKAKMATQLRDKCPPGMYAAFLLKTFRRLDLDNDGYLEREEMKKILTEEGINLKLDPAELDQAISAMSKEEDGAISFPDFMKYFQFEQATPAYNLACDGRAQHIQKLQAYVAHMNAEHLQPEDTQHTQNVLRHKHLTQRLRMGPASEEAMNPNDERPLQKIPSAAPEYPNLRKVLELRRKQEPQVNRSSEQNEENPFFISRTNACTGKDIFQGVASKQLHPVIQSKFSQDVKNQELTANTWDRVCLGESVNKDCGLFDSSSRRFITTNQEMFYPCPPDDKRSDMYNDAQQKKHVVYLRAHRLKLYGEQAHLNAELKEAETKKKQKNKTRAKAQRMLEYIQIFDQLNTKAQYNVLDATRLCKRPNPEMANKILGSNVPI